MRRLAGVMLALLWLGMSAGCAGQRKQTRGFPGASQYEFHRAIALTLLRTDQPSQAISHLRSLQRMRPTDAEPFFLMGQAYLQLGVPRSAHEMLDRALALDPTLAGAHSVIGILLDGEGEHAQAEAAHRRAIALDDGNAMFHNNLGFCLYVQGRASEAAAAYERALTLDAGLRRVHNNIGFAYGRLGELERAQAHFRLAGTPGEAENNMGVVHEMRGERDRACERYRTAVAVAPKLAEARANLARVCGQGAPVVGAAPMEGGGP